MADGAAPDSGSINWAESVEIVRRRWIVVVAAIVAFGWFALLWAEVQRPDPLYRASAQVLLELRATNSPFKSSGGIEDPRRAMSTEIARLSSEEVRSLVAARLPNAAGVSAASVGETDIFAINAVSDDPELAAATANAYAEAYVEARRQRLLDAYEVAMSALEERLQGFDEQLAEYSAELADDSIEPFRESELEALRASVQRQRDVIEQKLVQYQVDSEAETGGSRVFSPAFTPTARFNTTNPARAGAVGAFAGAVVGLALLVLLERRGDQLRNPRQVAALAGLPMVVIGSASHKRRARARQRVEAGDVEPYRRLRAFLIARGGATGTVLVTSPASVEDTATTAFQLAQGFARSGRDVVLVSAVFGDSPLAEAVGPLAATGLGNVLTGDASLASVLVAHPEMPNLAIAPAGDLSPGIDAADLVASARMDLALTEATDHFDVVILECPSVLDSSIGTTLAHKADEALVVVRLGGTRRRELRAALDDLGAVGATRPSLVVIADDGPHWHADPAGPRSWRRAAEPVRPVGGRATVEAVVEP